MDTVIISLKDSLRRQKIEKIVKNLDLNYRIVDAVDGRKIFLRELYLKEIYEIIYEGERYLYNPHLRMFHHQMGRGEIGCSLSHIRLYKEFVKSDNDYLLVLEDDVIPLVSKQILHGYLRNLPNHKDFDVCHIGISDQLKFIKESDFSDLYYSPTRRYINRSSSYVVTQRGANKILNSCYPCFGRLADDQLTNLYLLDKEYILIVPNIPLFGTDESVQSEICQINNNKSIN